MSNLIADKEPAFGAQVFHGDELLRVQVAPPGTRWAGKPLAEVVDALEGRLALCRRRQNALGKGLSELVEYLTYEVTEVTDEEMDGRAADWELAVQQYASDLADQIGETWKRGVAVLDEVARIVPDRPIEPAPLEDWGDEEVEGVTSQRERDFYRDGEQINGAEGEF